MESKFAISDKKFSPTSNILLFKRRKTKVLKFYLQNVFSESVPLDT